MYDQYKTTGEWVIIEKAINDLIKNQDLKLTTAIEYVVGYITKSLIEQPNHGA